MRVQIGERHNSFTVVALAARGSLGKHRRFVVRCDCGRELEKASADIKRQKSCGCLEKFDGRFTLYNSHLRFRHSKYGGPFIDYEEFVALAGSPCSYCGAPPGNETYGVKYTGIDRIDTDKGYCPGNVRAACWPCNRMRSNMSEAEFIAHVRRIVERWSAYPWPTP